MKRILPELAKGSKILALYENITSRATISLFEDAVLFVVYSKNLKLTIECHSFKSVPEASFQFRKYVSFMES